VLERYYRELLGFLAHKVSDRNVADDLAQESYVRMLTMQRAGEAIADPRALLYRIARNLVVDRHRRRQVRTEVIIEGEEAELHAAGVPAPEVCEPETAAISAQGVDALLAAIEGLPPRCREAFVLHKFEGLSHAEVAERMGVSRKMVEQHVKNAMLACRRCRKALEGDAAPGEGK